MSNTPKKRRLESQDCELAHRPECEKTTAQLRRPTTSEEQLFNDNFVPSLSDRRLRKYLKIENILIVENQNLVDKFQTFKSTLHGIHQMETESYLLVDSDVELSRIINSGLSAGSSILNEFARTDYGVTVHQFIDQVTPAPFFNDIKLRILCFKSLRGNIREVELDYTPVCLWSEFNSHVVRPIHDRPLTPSDEFRSYTVFHFEFGGNGTPVKTPSALLPYAIFDLVPTYSEKDLSSQSPSRLMLSYSPIHPLSVNLPGGANLLAGTLCDFSTVSVHGRRPAMPNLFSLRFQGQYYEWKMLLKFPIFVALLEQNSWGKLLKESEVEIKVEDNFKFYASYWTFFNDSSEFPKLIPFMQLNQLSFIEFCGDTSLFLFPNGQLASLLGIPYNDGSLMHCVAVNCEPSTIDMLPEAVGGIVTKSNSIAGLGMDGSNRGDIEDVDMEISDSTDNEDCVNPFEKDEDSLLNIALPPATSCSEYGKINEIGISTEEHFGGNIRGSSSNEIEISNSTSKVAAISSLLWRQKKEELFRKVTKHLEDPIIRGVFNYVKAGPGPQIYNGCLELGFTEEWQRRRALLSTVSQSVHRQFLSTAPSEYACAQMNPESEMEPSRPEDNIEHERNIYKPLVIFIDTDVLYGSLKPSDFAMFLRRVSVENILHKLEHKVLYHRLVEEDFCRRILQNESPDGQTRLMIEHLTLLKEYEQKNIVIKMDPHRCDELGRHRTSQDKIRCLWYSIARVRRQNPSTNIVYLTDLEECTIQDRFIDPRIRFMDYTSWIKIFQ